MPLHKIIQRYYKLAIKENINDFNSKFRKTFKELCKSISTLSNFVKMKDFEEFLGTPKVISPAFLGNQEELIKFSNLMEDLKMIGKIESTEKEFNHISSLAHCLCGINLHIGKKELVRARLGKRLRALSSKSFNGYIEISAGNENDFIIYEIAIN